MAKYLRTSSISAELENLIRDAREKVYIISPYLKLSDGIRDLLNDKERQKVEVRIIFGKQELNPTEMTYLQSLKYVRLFFSKNLHAKCYLSESKMIITSMNLYEFSQQNNKEMGILVDKSDEHDRTIYDDAWNDIESLLFNADDFSYVKAPSAKIVEAPEKNSSPAPKTAKSPSSPTGFCIRTGVPIPFNTKRPMSDEAYKSWSKFSNPDYAEKFCHFSGEPSNGETTFSKPILRKNWAKAKGVFGNL